MRVLTSKSDRGHPKEEFCQIIVSIRPNYAPKRQTVFWEKLRLWEEFWFWFLKVFLKRNVSETSKFGFCSSRTDGKRVHRSVGLHGAELWPFEVITLLEESDFKFSRFPQEWCDFSLRNRSQHVQKPPGDLFAALLDWNMLEFGGLGFIRGLVVFLY